MSLFFRVHTLGCKVNQYESEYCREALLRLGFAEVPENETPDLLLINTCAVTSESDQKSRKVVRKMIAEHPHAEVIVFGCSARFRPEMFHSISGVAKVFANQKDMSDWLQQIGLEDECFGIRRFGERHRAYIKVQDGCQVGCSYCIIPKVRPILKSRPIPEVVAEVQNLFQNGYKEIVLTGIHLGHYGIDLPVISGEKPCLDRLVAELLKLKHYFQLPFRIRLSSLEAVEVSDELIHLMSQNPDVICPHFHLSMQSGSNDILRQMKRRWMREPFIERCLEIVSKFDRPALTTDVIVGFPGETESHFDETIQAVEQLRFSKIHLFRFSARRGTEAATLSNQVSPQVQKERARRLADIADKLRMNFAASLVSSNLSVLVENEWGGTADRYIDVKFLDRKRPELIGQLVSVHICESEGEILRGIPVSMNSNLVVSITT
ncbi:MAG: tRNA (N(6)-L-threonylcarbamoyladenosine(37)-C(2))-methylthiotransferase MtaB [Thermoguttaceae bacterium]